MNKRFNGLHLKKYRIEAGLTQLELANKVNSENNFHVVDVTTIARWEHNPTAAPRNNKIVKVARTLGVPVETLYDFELESDFRDDSGEKADANLFCDKPIEKATIRVMAWNIHGAGGYGNYAIPNFVADKIISENVDIAVVVEFITGRGWDYLIGTLEKTYDLFISPYTSCRNQVMIALKKEKGFEVKRILTENSVEKEKPEFLHIETELEGKSFSIIGIRVKNQGTDEQIDEQFEFLKVYLKELENTNIVCAGDFNVWRNPLSKKLNISSDYIFTPKYSMMKGNFQTLDNWSAVIKNHKMNVVGKSLIDHIIARGVGIREVNEVKYSWDFITKKNNYGNLKSSDYKSHLVGLPDHAILSATIKIND